MKAKHYFAAANSGQGFYNCFDYINDNRRDGVLYILKGGPGTGKSTLMKKIGSAFEEKGGEVEYFYCSSDERSLDGVRLVSANAAIVDGTAPHVTEAALPGVSDFIVNLGEFIGAGVKAQKEKIQKLIVKKKECFDTAYAYIRAAAQLDSANMLLLAGVTDMQAVKDVANKILQSLEISGGNESRERRLFLSAVAGGGKASLCAANKYDKVVGLSGNAYAARAVLEELASRLYGSGNDFVSFCELLAPDKREALQIDGINTLITSGDTDADSEISLKDTLISGKYEACRDRVLYGQDAVNGILGLAAKALSDAKAAHGEIEAHYIPEMDFDGLNRVAEALIKTISEL